jgi:membrane peptidoglycan carboxypeptidase
MVTEVPGPAAMDAPGEHRRPDVWRVLARAAGATVLVLAAGALVLWVATPSVNDLDSRVRQEATRHGTTVLTPGEVPPLLAEAVVATEDERFYQHHGIDVIGLGRAEELAAARRITSA